MNTDLRIGGHVERDDDTPKMRISYEKFKTIQSGDTVFLKDGKTGVMMHRLTKSIYLTGEPRIQVYPEDLIFPFFEAAKEKDKPKKTPAKPAPAKAVLSIAKPAPKKLSENTLKIKRLIKENPDFEDEIFNMALIEKLSVDEIEGVLLMANAGRKAQANTM